MKWIERDRSPGESVVIVQYMITSPGAMIKAVERARAEGLDVVKVAVFVDR